MQCIPLSLVGGDYEANHVLHPNPDKDEEVSSC